MGKVIYTISMSLDGFIAAANVRPEAGLGDGGERLHEWVFNSADPRNREILAKSARLGAIITGRHTYDLSIPYWGADGPTGAARVTTVVVSHTIPHNIPDGGVYRFAESIEAALATAKNVAGDKDVEIMGGADVARQFLTLGFIDEISIHLIPVLFGSGIPLLGQLSGHIQLETTEVIDTPEATHIRYRLRR
jgi:dihydrofolate reductase